MNRFSPFQANPAADHIELSDGGHVYTNPNYPTLEIGGMPFYLMPATELSPPKSSLAANSNSNPCENNSKSSQSTTGFYEPGGSTLSGRSGGPIYEDIDR